MSIHSGKFAVVNGQSTVRNWSVNDTMTPAKVIASNTRFGNVRKKGIRSWTGSFGSYGAVPTVMPGELFTFTGYTAPTNDISGNGMTYSGQAIVDSVAITWNYTNGEPLSYVTNFSGHMALTATTSTAPTDLTAPNILIPCPTKWQFDNGSGFTDFDNLTQAVLNITAANLSYVNSSTSSGGHCWTGRRSGPIDWSLALTIQDDIRSGNMPAIADDCKLKGFIDATDFWDLWWGHVRDFSGLTADRESGALLQVTVNMDMNGYNGGIGRVRKPGAVTDWWPL